MNSSLSYTQSQSYYFNCGIAKKFGVNAAVFIQNLQFWIKKNMANRSHQHDGRTWTYNSREALTELFPFWSTDQIKRIIERLKKARVIRVQQLNKNKYDHTNWYAFEDEKLFLGQETKMLAAPVDKELSIDRAKSPNHLGKFDRSSYITDNNTYKTLSSSHSTSSFCKKTNQQKRLKEFENTIRQERKITSLEDHEKPLYVLAYLNVKTKHAFRAAPTHLKMISKRFAEGYTVQDMISVIKDRYRRWRDDGVMNQYLRPKTLFSEKNFANYLGMINVPRQTWSAKAANHANSSQLSSQAPLEWENELKRREKDNLATLIAQFGKEAVKKMSGLDKMRYLCRPKVNHHHYARAT